MPTLAPATLEFSNVRILVRDFARSWAFYRDVLGLTPAKGHGEPPYGEFVFGGRSLIGLFEERNMAEATGLEGGPYPATVVGRSALILETADVDSVARELERRHVPLVAGPTDRPAWQLRTIHLRDPDGYLIEIYSALKSPTDRPVA
jgi:lactoylglutathione lyase